MQAAADELLGLPSLVQQGAKGQLPSGVPLASAPLTCAKRGGIFVLLAYVAFQVVAGDVKGSLGEFVFPERSLYVGGESFQDVDTEWDLDPTALDIGGRDVVPVLKNAEVGGNNLNVAVGALS
jgi:hypothetical protein